ncbi:Hpt domain-containing protein [Sulfurimonas sp. CS5]|uniref:HPt domain-containing protein n=1 Tax=uncultured microorganism TaxID=358574 RepID=L8AXT6_9ZZZZ|nr:hypothetical protein [uncultured microorganism]
MLIYNYQKEFVGIDESDLNALGFSNLSQLRSESADFADLFVKTPGFVHNFKHVHWIDFVTCAEGSEDSKVIIHANEENFRCTLDIKTAYLVDDPSQKAYIINLVNLRALTHNENEQVAEDVLEKPAPEVTTQSAAIFNTLDFEDDKHTKTIAPQSIEVTHDPYEVTQTNTLDQLEENPKVVEDIYEDEPIEIDNIQESVEELPEIQEAQEEEPLPPLYTQSLNVGNEYVYDPHLASNELGLPVDLIEEFIEDFISQANEFKDDLYNSLNDDNTDNVKIQSHKLKGVAANLRIEDAFEILSTINTSEDIQEIKTNIDMLYIIIEKLSKKATQPVAPIEVEQSIEKEVSNENDDLILSFKDDIEEIKIDDSEVPETIIMPELADDDFLTIDEIQDQKIEEITLDEDISKADELDKITLDDDIENITQKFEQEVSQTSLSAYNKAEVAIEIGIDTESFEKLFNDFVIEGKNICREINSAIEQGDASSWKRTAIELKGMSDNMRIDDFKEELELIIHTQDANEAKDAMDAINAKFQQISGVKD